jgi:dephospho-CoA kinase
MLALKKVAVTGSVASGKSLVCDLLGECGAFVVKMDDLVHQILDTDLPLQRQLTSLLGESVISNQKADRRKIADKVFGAPSLLEQLEQLVHPKAFHLLEEIYAGVLKSQKYLLFVVEFPLLFELNKQGFYDQIIWVEASQDLCMRRFSSRGGSSEQYEQRNQRFYPTAFKKGQADLILQNQSDLASLRRTVHNLYHQLTTH